MSSENDQQQTTFCLALVGVLLQVGCVTLVLTLGSVLAGLGLDKQLGTLPLFTISLLLISVPLNGYLLWRIALSAGAKLNPPVPKTSGAERESEAWPIEEE